MLTLYRRHGRNCLHRHDGRDYRRCKCPLWVQGSLAGEGVRKSLDLTSWESAQERVRVWEARGSLTAQLVPIPEAIEKYLADCTARHLKLPTIEKHRYLLERQLIPWCERESLKFLDSLDVEAIREFRATWSDSPISATKKVERLRSFFRFCRGARWIAENPASELKPPKVVAPPVEPFTDFEEKKILEAVARYPTKNTYGYDNRARVRAFILTLRWTGLRIGDVTGLRRDRLVKGKLRMRTMKTGTVVWLPLHPDATAALEALPGDGEFFYWSGVGLLKSCVADWQRSLRRLFSLAGLEGAHAHRYRHSFACHLLQEGIPVETVAVLLGHSTPAITSKHYSSWVKSRQRILEDAVGAIWGTV